MPGLLRSHLKDRNMVLIGLAPTGRMAVSCALDNFSYLGLWSLRSQKQTVWGRLTSSLCPSLCSLPGWSSLLPRHLTMGQKRMGFEFEGHGRQILLFFAWQFINFSFSHRRYLEERKETHQSITKSIT